MITGRLDKKITLQQPTETEDAYGEEISTFSDYATVFASATQTGAREMYQAGKVSEVDMVFKARYMPAVTEKWRVVCDGVIYEIVGRPKELGRQDGLEIMGRALT